MTVDEADSPSLPADAEQQPTVLVVDDEPSLVELLTVWLTGDYQVRSATSGPEALEVIDTTVDVVLLDRRMPTMDGDTVLTELRDRGIDAMVAMVTAVEPGADIIDLPFDEYVIKPIDRETAVNTVKRLIQRRAYTVQARQCFELAAKLTILESSPKSPLANRKAVRGLRERLTEELTAADETIRALIESGGIEGAVIDIER